MQIFVLACYLAELCLELVELSSQYFVFAHSYLQFLDLFVLALNCQVQSLDLPSDDLHLVHVLADSACYL